MKVQKPKPRQHVGDDTRPVNILLHRFMIHPIANKRDTVLAHEFCDLDVRSHLLSEGLKSILPPWPEVENLYWFEEKAGSGSFKIGVVRRVTMPEHLKNKRSEVVEGDPDHPYIGLVYLSTLKRIAGRQGEFKTSVQYSPFSWKCLGEYVTSNYHATGFSKGVPISSDGVYVQS